MNIPYILTANACSYRARTFHLKRTIDHIVDDLFYPGSLLWILAVVHNTGMEVAVTDVTQDTGKET